MNQYIREIQNSKEDIYIQIANAGGFFAEFYVDYIEGNGDPHSEDSGVFTIGTSRRINILPGTPRVKLQVEVWIFGQGKIMYDGYIQTRTPSCFTLFYTIFNPTMEKVPCAFLGGTPIPPNNQSCCFCNYSCNYDRYYRC